MSDMTNHVYIAASLDGFIADPAGSLDWLHELPNPENSDFGYAESMSGIDAIVMGRGTFETVLTFGEWPYDKPVFVLTSSLEGVPPELAGKVELVGGDVAAVARYLRSRGYVNLYIDGGRTVQSFLKADLVDELVLTTVPVLLGGGVPLFGDIGRRLAFRRGSTETLTPQLTKTRYVRDRSTSPARPGQQPDGRERHG
jgi:dihydrofolate reductase